jgi:hypothetical protein
VARSPGEALDTAPIVKGFSILNSTCQNVDQLGVGQPIPEGGISLLCTVQKDAAAFSLNTDRGQCVEAGTPQLPAMNF